MANPVGRPPLFTSAEEMQTAIDAYFSECRTEEKPCTMSGLALALDMDRRSLLNYSNKGEFFPTIKRARDRVENDVETRLLSGAAVAGAIFNLKNNFDWKDKSETEHSGSMRVEKVERVIIDPANTDS